MRRCALRFPVRFLAPLNADASQTTLIFPHYHFSMRTFDTARLPAKPELRRTALTRDPPPPPSPPPRSPSKENPMWTQNPAKIINPTVSWEVHIIPEEKWSPFLFYMNQRGQKCGYSFTSSLSLSPKKERSKEEKRLHSQENQTVAGQACQRGDFRRLNMLGWSWGCVLLLSSCSSAGGRQSTAWLHWSLRTERLRCSSALQERRQSTGSLWNPRTPHLRESSPRPAFLLRLLLLGWWRIFA